MVCPYDRRCVPSLEVFFRRPSPSSKASRRKDGVAVEDQQDKHQAADFYEITSWVWESSGLDPSPSQSQKVCLFEVIHNSVKTLSHLTFWRLGKHPRTS